MLQVSTMKGCFGNRKRTATRDISWLRERKALCYCEIIRRQDQRSLRRKCHLAGAFKLFDCHRKITSTFGDPITVLHFITFRLFRCTAST